MNGLFIAVLCSFCGFLIGLALTKKHVECELYYKDAVKFCVHLINNISFKADKISSVIDSAEVTSTAFLRNVNEYKAYVTGGEFTLSENCLSKSEAAAIKEFFMQLGRFDGETQLDELKRRKGEFELRYGELKAENDKNGSMYVKLGLLFGLLVGILLI